MFTYQSAPPPSPKPLRTYARKPLRASPLTGRQFKHVRSLRSVRTLPPWSTPLPNDFESATNQQQDAQDAQHGTPVQKQQRSKASDHELPMHIQIECARSSAANAPLPNTDASLRHSNNDAHPRSKSRGLPNLELAMVSESELDSILALSPISDLSCSPQDPILDQDSPGDMASGTSQLIPKAASSTRMNRGLLRSAFAREAPSRRRRSRAQAQLCPPGISPTSQESGSDGFVSDELYLAPKPKRKRRARTPPRPTVAAGLQLHTGPHPRVDFAVAELPAAETKVPEPRCSWLAIAVRCSTSDTLGLTTNRTKEAVPRALVVDPSLPYLASSQDDHISDLDNTAVSRHQEPIQPDDPRCLDYHSDAKSQFVWSTAQVHAVLERVVAPKRRIAENEEYIEVDGMDDENQILFPRTL